MRCGIPRGLLILCIWGVALGAHAVERGDKKPGKFRLGPLYLTPAFRVTAGVDNNVYNDDTNAVGDTALSATPSVEAVLPVTRHARLTGTGGFTPFWFRRERSERHTDVFGNSGAEIDIGPLSVFGGVGAGKYRRRFSLEIDERVSRRESSDSAGVSARLGARFVLTASRRSVTTRYEEGVAVANGQRPDLMLDRESVTQRLDFRVAVTRRTAVVPFIDLVEDRFLHTPTTVQSRRYGAAIEFGELAFLQGRVAIGRRQFDPGQAVHPYSGLFLNATVTTPFLLKTQLVLGLQRDVAYTLVRAAEDGRQNTAVNSLYRTELLANLPLRLHARANVRYEELGYLLPIEGEAESVPRREHAWSYGGALLRRLGERVSIGGTVERSRRRSRLVDRSYVQMLYGLTAEVRF